MLTRIGAALDSPIVTLGGPQRTHLRVQGGQTLSGRIDVNTSKNGAVALLCASLLNRGTTRLRNVARIVEVDRIVEVLRSVGVRATWSTDGRDLEIVVPEHLAARRDRRRRRRRTRSIIMFLGPLLGLEDEFRLPYAGGCDLGTRTVEPHLIGLRPFGLDVTATAGDYHGLVTRGGAQDLSVVLTERGDTVTENVIMAAAGARAITTIRNASPNYMVQDLCFYLELLGVRIDGIGTTTLRVHGLADIDADVEYAVSEDPVEAMSLLTAGIVTGSEITVGRVPIEFMEIELATLAEMGLRYTLSARVRRRQRPHPAGRRHRAPQRAARADRQDPPDAVPRARTSTTCRSSSAIAACAEGSTLVHDWVYEGRAIHLTDLTRLGADVRLLDAHRLQVTGPTHWSGAEVSCPPALRPAVVILLAMLAAKGTSVLRDVDIIARGYEQLQERLVRAGRPDRDVPRLTSVAGRSRPSVPTRRSRSHDRR